jgi:hypothetical protein
MAAELVDKKTKEKKEGDKKKKRRKVAPTQCTYIAKIAKKYVGEDKKDKSGKVVEKNPNKLTFSKAAISEVEMMINHAIGTLVENSDKVLTYTGGRTLGKSTVELATTLAFAGVLRDKAMKAGSQAVINYNGFDPTAPPESVLLEVP